MSCHLALRRTVSSGYAVSDEVDAPVLIVDDETDLTNTLARLLGAQGYRVVTAGTRGEALGIIRERPLGLVICDLRLPDGDGLDVVRATVATPPHTPAIVVTGFPSPTTRRAALEAGAAEYLAKPFPVASLLEAVQKAFRPAAARPPRAAAR